MTSHFGSFFWGILHLVSQCRLLFEDDDTARSVLWPLPAKRQVNGRPACPHTRRTCPYGVHACSACGNVGHGAADCRLHAPQTEVEVEEPQVEPTPPLPAFARPKSASVSVPLPAESRQYEAQYVPGFGKREKESLPIMVLAFHPRHPFRLLRSRMVRCPAVLQLQQRLH